MTAAQLEQQIAETLLSIGAVTLRPHQPYTWTSGIRSPIYCDNRLTMSHPRVREQIADGFAALVRERFPETETIAGTATAGIPHAAWTAQKLDLPMVYVRDKAKGHGKQNQIEGELRPGQKTIVIEDLISTGGSSLKAALAVNEAGGRVLGVLAIFSYEFDVAAAAFRAEGIPLYALSGYSALVEAAVRTGRIRPEDVGMLEAWRSDPARWTGGTG